MKATGIIRRIDDLGRVVIPKEVRRNLGIKEGDALEIFTDRGIGDKGCVCFQKYVPDALTDNAPIWQKILLARIGCKCTFYDTSGYVVASNERAARIDAKEDIDEIKNEYNVFAIKSSCYLYDDSTWGYLRVWGYDADNPAHDATVQTVLALMYETL